ncbi:MAG: hypothetical protein IPL92_17675 [Saprospiraceae bacterium]|nr:hypothetical protein [Candidatus Opimibacter iunctus]
MRSMGMGVRMEEGDTGFPGSQEAAVNFIPMPQPILFLQLAAGGYQ